MEVKEDKISCNYLQEKNSATKTLTLNVLQNLRLKCFAVTIL